MAVALVNYSPVQSLIGKVVGDYFSKEWNAKVRVGSVNINPFSHVILRDIELISPTGDTIAESQRIACYFKHNPISSSGLNFDRVSIRNTYYHLVSDTTGLNLNFIIDYFASEKPDTSTVSHPFVINIGTVSLHNVHYKMDFTESSVHYDHGVDIPHMEFLEINGNIKNVRVDGDHITCKVENLSTYEKSGFHVKKLNLNAYVTSHAISATDFEILTDSTTLIGDALLDYYDWSSMSEYCDSVYMVLNLKQGSYVEMSDVAYWAPALWGIKSRLDVSGNFCGPVADLKANNVDVFFGDSSSLYFDGSITGLPYIESTMIVGNVHQLNTNYADLMGVQHPDWVTVKVPDLLQKLGDISLDGSFAGLISDFYVMLNLDSDLGNLGLDLLLRYDKQTQDYSYVCEVGSTELKLSKLFPNEWVSRSGFSLSLQGTGLSLDKMNASLDGQLFNTIFRGNNIDGATLSASMENKIATADLYIKDTLLDVDLAASINLSDSVPICKATVKVDEFNMVGLHLLNNSQDSILDLSTTLQLSASGTDVENLVGNLSLLNTKLNRNQDQLNIKNLSLNAREIHGYKNLMFNSDFCALSLKGYYNYSGLGKLVQRLIQSYVPAYYNKYARESLDYSLIADADFDMKLVWTDSLNKIQFFLPELQLAKGTTLDGSYQFEKSLSMLFRSDSISWGSIKAYDIGLEGEDFAGFYKLTLQADKLQTGALDLFKNLKLTTNSGVSGGNLNLVWNNADEIHPWLGDISCRWLSDSTQTRFAIPLSKFNLDNQQWTLQTKGDVVVEQKKFLIPLLKLYSGKQLASVSLLKSGTDEDALRASFEKFNLSSFSSLLASAGLGVDGVLEGTVSMDGLNEVPHLDANMTIEDLSINDQKLGNTELLTNWKSDQNLLAVNLKSSLRDNEGHLLTPVHANGDIFLGEDSPLLNLVVDFEDLSMQVAQPYVKSLASELGGYLNGNVKISGSLKEPEASGKLAIKQGRVKVDMLNERFSFDDTILITPRSVLLDDFVIKDENSNELTLNGRISHNHFQEISYDATVKTPHFQVMNTNASGSDAYYGKLFAALDAYISGTLQDIDIRANVTTRPGSELYVPIDDKKQTRDLSYVEFVSYDNDYVVHKTEEKESTSNFKYKVVVNLEVTPDVKLSLPIDYSPMTLDVQTAGRGDLQIAIAQGTDLSVMGSYELTSGSSMNLSLGGVINNMFTIQEGSVLNFKGPISDASFDIKAVYTQRVNLATLVGTTSSSFQKNVPVSNVIAVSGSLDNPSISFDIQLPNADQSLEDEVFAYIDRTNERDMLNQTISLLVMKQFYNSSTSNMAANGGFLSNGLSSGYSVVANSLGSVVSNMVQFVDVNFDFRAANELTSEQVDVDISKDWGKVYFESTLGFGGDDRQSVLENSNNNITGDVLVGLKLSQQLHLYAFNRNNTNDYTRNDLPYKQGVGLKWTHDFNKWSDLFKTKKRKNGK